MTKSIWLEVALNGIWTRKRQPKVPIQPDEIIKEAVECARAGAAIIHYHAFDKNGQEINDLDTNIHIIEEVRSQADVIVYPTVNILSKRKLLVKMLDTNAMIIIKKDSINKVDTVFKN